jgi:adenosylhomocysteine nucleosidase
VSEVEATPIGEYFVRDLGDVGGVTFLRGGWGKIAAGASLSFACAVWQPNLIINIGTCSGFRGRVEKGDLIVVRRAVVYDIIEAMSDSDDAVEAMSTSFDLGWLPDSLPQLATIASGDRDIQPLELD